MGSSFLTKDETQAPALTAWNLHPWTTREVPALSVETQPVVWMFLHAALCLLFSLSCEQGEHGVKEVLDILKNEFHTSMTLTGKFLPCFS